MNTPDPSNRGRLLILAAAVMWSLSGFFVKSPPLQDLPGDTAGPTIGLWRCAFAALFLLPFVRWRRLRWHPALLPMVLSFASMNLLLMWSMTRTTAANAILLQYTAPLWMVVGAVLLLGERLERRNLAALGLGMLGMAVILVAFWGGAEAAGVFMGLGAGVSYAGVVLSLRVLREHDPFVLVFLNHAVSAAVLVPWIVAVDAPLPSSGQLAVLAAFGLVQMAAPYVIFARGIARVSPQEAGVITLLEPVINPLWVFVFWRESVHLATLIGGGLIVLGLLVRYLPRRRKRGSGREGETA